MVRKNGEGPEGVVRRHRMPSCSSHVAPLPKLDGNGTLSPPPRRTTSIRRSHLPRGKLRIALVQTQAEQAGAQEISRILGRGFEAHGYEVHHVFFFRRTCAFDDQPNTYFCTTGRPAGPLALLRMLNSWIRLR